MYWKEGFYGYPIEGGIEITAEYWQALLDGQSAGKNIVSDERGFPILKDPEPPTDKELRLIEIDNLKIKLSETDWIHAKYADLGLVAQSKYPDILKDRIAWRERINELEEMNVGD